MDLLRTTKICNKCHKEYPATLKYFNKDSHKHDGLRPSCKKCYNEYRKQYWKSYKYRPVSTYEDTQNNIQLDKNWENNKVIKKFKKLYLESLLPIHKIQELIKLSHSNIQFLIEELGIRMSKSQRHQLIKKKRKEYFTSIRPSKEALEQKYKEMLFSIPRLRYKYFPDVPVNNIKEWLDELEIERRWALKYQSREQRISNIIKHLKKIKNL